ncbi:hypothetical protein BN946_scf184753.g46 [Trametes cinnabarina]|uniref:Uncharacterized protein n=1 Tax=Pycnoporus cinnabarinus TaxID=5643 RepID=A0A060ST54_PYCCI|nr:hypothetical protein BN946_scf184753.g46 [Trametes cinnabarina]
MATFDAIFEFEDVPPPSESTTPSRLSSSAADDSPEQSERGTSPSDNTGPSGRDPSLPVASDLTGSRASSGEPQTPLAGQRRHAAEAFDLTQEANWASRRVRLKPSEHDALLAISKLSPAQREMWTDAMLLKMNQRLEAIAPADAQWTISQNLKVDKIEQYTNAVLCSPVLGEYVTKQNSTKLVAGILARHPSWGYSQEVQADKYKRDIVLARIGQRLTDRRSDMKEVILLSLGPELQPSAGVAGYEPKKPKVGTKTDIVQLCSDILARCQARNLIVTVQMCGRVALLRKTMVAILKNPEARFEKYWYYVDAQLLTLRTKYPADPEAVSRIIKKTLDDDLKQYGGADLPSSVRAERMQEVADSAATGAFDTLED